MTKKRYILNEFSYYRFLELNRMVLKSRKGRFYLSGDNISEIVCEILGCFKDSARLDDVVNSFPTEYTKKSITNMINLLIEKEIIIDVNTADSLQSYDRDFVENTMYYSLGGKSMSLIKRELAAVRIGVIGTRQIVQCLVRELIFGGLLLKYNIGITDRSYNDDKIVHDSSVEVVKYKNLANPVNMEALIESSDFIIAASNFYDHYFLGLLNELCIKNNKSWIRIVTDGDTSEVGPLFIPGETCCYSCLRTRAQQNMSEKQYIIDSFYSDPKMHLDSMEKTVGLFPMYSINLWSSAIVSAETMKYLTGLKSNLINQVAIIDSIKYDVKLDTIFKDYLCPVCAEKV